MLHMGIILEKDIHDHESNMSVIPAPSLVSVNTKVDNNNVASVIDVIVVESASL